MTEQQRAAMQMALEALIANLRGTSGRFPLTNEAITALREALAQPQDEDTKGLMYLTDVDMPEAFRDHKKRIAELEQNHIKKKALDKARERLAQPQVAPDGRIAKTVFTLEDVQKAAEMGRAAGIAETLYEPKSDNRMMEMPEAYDAKVRQQGK